MRNQIYSICIATTIMLSLCAHAEDSSQPVTRPAQTTLAPSTATAPATTVSIRGTVALGGDLQLDKPDLTRIVVYLESDPLLDSLSAAPVSATVAQKNKAFVPNFIAIAKETSVEFPNWDHISHNVFSRSAAAPAFDLDRYPYGQSKTRVFDKVGVVQVFCNIHPQMRAIIFVTPNRFFTRADATGHFQIDGLPPGHYTLSAWHDRCATEHQTVDVSPEGDAQINFTLEENHDAIMADEPPHHGDKYGVDRGLGIKREHLGLPVVTESHPATTTEPCDLCK